MGLRWESWTKTGQEGSRMFSTEQRRVAIETFIKFDHSYADTITELGYPHRQTLRNWWKEYEETGEIPIGKDHHRKSEYTDEQARAAAGYYRVAGSYLPAFSVFRGG